MFCLSFVKLLSYPSCAFVTLRPNLLPIMLHFPFHCMTYLWDFFVHKDRSHLTELPVKNQAGKESVIIPIETLVHS